MNLKNRISYTLKQKRVNSGGVTKEGFSLNARYLEILISRFSNVDRARSWCCTF